MKLSHRLRKLAHGIYYFKSSQKRNDFALRCHDVTGDIDLNIKPKTLLERFRFRLHLGICQACKNYHNLSLGFTKSMHKHTATRNEVKDKDLNRITDDLLKKYSRKA